MKNKWYGTAPKRCNRCFKPLKEFVDGRTKGGVWAILCLDCHKDVGVGLGVGRGQKYTMKVIKGGGIEWIKVKKIR